MQAKARPRFVTVGAAIVAAITALAHAPTALAGSDFNGDGRSDLAIGAAREGLPGAEHAGAIHVLYGAHRRLGLRRRQYLTEATPGISGRPKFGDELGYALSGGDFDGDGYDDLAAGTPGTTFPRFEGYDHGLVHVIYGSRDGLDRHRERSFSQAMPGIAERPGTSDTFGGRLSTGDFDGDGYDDLAIGARGEGLGPQRRSAGVVHVLYGSRHGLSAKRSALFSGDSRGIAGDGAEAYAVFGTVETGDFDGDGYDELAIAAASQDADGVRNSGAVTIVRGSSRGLTTRRSRWLTQETPGIAGNGAQSGDGFGTALTALDVDGDRREDLVVSAPGETITEPGEPQEGFGPEHGAITVLFGSRRGLRPHDSQFVSSQDPALAGGPQPADSLWGVALAAGRLDNDRFGDVAVGAPFANLPSANWRGSVHVLFGSPMGLSASASKRIHQGTAGLRGDGLAEGDLLGSTLAIANLNDSPPQELVIGEPQDIDDEFDGCGAGGVHVLYPNLARGLLARGNAFITQDTAGIGGDGAEPCDAFSLGLGAG